MTETLAGRALTLIHLGRAPTRSALTAGLGVTRATVGAVTGRLRELGLIRIEAGPDGAGQGGADQGGAGQGGAGQGGGGHGRPSHRLGIDPGGPVVLAAEIHPDGHEVALVGLGGRIIAAERRHGAVPADPARALAPLARDGARLLARSGQRRSGQRQFSQRQFSQRRCVGAALAVASAVSSPEGAVAGELNLGWPAGAPVRAIFAEFLRAEFLKAELLEAGLLREPADVVVVNDINAAALAEHRHGAGTGSEVLLMVATGHRGVGGALVLGGTLFTGSGGLGMEAGHVTVDPDGRPCICGNRGCLNVETDAQRFLAAAGRQPGPGTLAPDRLAPDRLALDQAVAIMRDEYESDPAVRAAADGLTAPLGLALAGLINVLNPDRILLGGLHRQLLESAPALLREAITERSPWRRGAQVPVRAAALEQASLIGAAELAWQPVLDDPAVLDESGRTPPGPPA